MTGLWLLFGFVVFGLLIGVLFGFFGMGGSFLATPALLVLGYPGDVAVGSGLAFVFGTAIIAAIKHHDMGQVDVKLGAGVLAGTVAGIEIGKRFVVYLTSVGLAESVISLSYIALLGAVGVLTLRDAAIDEAADDRREEPSGQVIRFRTVRIPPVIAIQDDIEISLWPMLLVGLVTGLLAGVLGVGGGFILMPALVYGLGVPVTVAVGTDLFQIVFSGGFGAFRYAQLGSVALEAVVPLLAGSALGAILGAKATDIVDSDDIKGVFGGMLLAGSVAVASREAAAWTGIGALETVSLALLFGSALVVVGIIARRVQTVRRERSNPKATADPDAP